MGSDCSSSCVDDHEFHVLAVDDSLVDRKVIEKLLKISSCKVTAVESGSRALQYLGLDGDMNNSVKYDGMKVNLIMTDYSMPGMTGFELLKKIKGSEAFSEIPVVVMSSENVLTRIDRCLEEGAEEFLVKPVKLSDVKRLRECVLSSSKNNAADNGNKKASSCKRKLQLCDDTCSSSSPGSSSSSVEIDEPLLPSACEAFHGPSSKRSRLLSSD